MSTYAYLFEAKSIQSYILDSGRMRDLIGASELVDSLTTELLPDALKALAYQDESPIEFSRRAGGAIYAFTDDKAALDRFAALWSLLISQYAPGMSFDVGRGVGDATATAFAAARDAVGADASRARPALPVTAPITQRSARTGNPGVDFDSKDNTSIDRPTQRKKRFADLSKAGLLDRFSPPGADLRWRDWPRDMTPGEDGAFPFLGDNHTVALVHADGNGMGELLKRAGEAAKTTPDKYVTIFRSLSDAIAEITTSAAQHATATVLIPERKERRKPDRPDERLVLAARPIVLGGDDLTILVRADLALKFLRAFLDRFEEESANRLPKLEIGASRLTAGAGVVYMRASQPFYLATDLVESLMKFAKQRAKAIDAVEPPSTLAFHRVTQSMIEDYEEIVKREKTTTRGDEHYVNTLGTYALCRDQDLPSLDDLLGLQALLQRQDMSRGPTRQLHTLMGLAPGQAETAYRRWRQQMGDEANRKLGMRNQYDQHLKSLSLGKPMHPTLPFADFDEEYRSPLGDALTLMAVKSQIPEDANRTDEKEAAA
jgi:hypothetical protein